MPVMAVGLITEPEQAEAIIADGQADMVALARGFMDDPRWARHAAWRLGVEHADGAAARPRQSEVVAPGAASTWLRCRRRRSSGASEAGAAMSNARIYWVDAPDVGRIGVAQRPRVAADFAELKSGGVDVLVSMLEAGEANCIGLAGEAEFCRAAGIEFISLPVIDHGIPSTVEEMASLSGYLRKRLTEGKGVAAHCFAGLGRSPVMVAVVLIDSGLDAYAACELISTARGHDVPEMGSQVEWLLDYELRARS